MGLETEARTTHHLGVLLKCRIRFSGSEVIPRVCVSNRLPSDTDATGPWITLGSKQGPDRPGLNLGCTEFPGELLKFLMPGLHADQFNHL